MSMRMNENELEWMRMNDNEWEWVWLWVWVCMREWNEKIGDWVTETYKESNTNGNFAVVRHFGKFEY